MIAHAGQMQPARLWLIAEMRCHLDETWAAVVGTKQLGAKVHEGVMLEGVMCISSASPQTSCGCWKGAEGLICPVMMNFVILSNGSRNLTKSHLLFVILLDAKNNNQPPSSQNEINCNST